MLGVDRLSRVHDSSIFSRPTCRTLGHPAAFMSPGSTVHSVPHRLSVAQCSADSVSSDQAQTLPGCVRQSPWDSQSMLRSSLRPSSEEPAGTLPFPHAAQTTSPDRSTHTMPQSTGQEML